MKHVEELLLEAMKDEERVQENETLKAIDAGWISGESVRRSSKAGPLRS